MTSLNFSTHKNIMSRLMISIQYKPQNQNEAELLIDSYFKSFESSGMTEENLIKVAGILITSWAPSFGRKFPSVKEFLDIGKVSVSTIANKAHTALRWKIMHEGSNMPISLGVEHRHFVAMECIRRMGGWVVVAQQGVESWNKNESRFCGMYEGIFYDDDISKKPLLGTSDRKNAEFLANYNTNQIEGSA